MSWIQRLFGGREIRYVGAIYDPVEGGKPIPLDEAELEWVTDAIKRENESRNWILAKVAEAGKRIPDGAFNEAVPPTAALALASLAVQRYGNGNYIAASNTAIRALGFSAIGGGFLVAQMWQLLARIHATVGRFETAGRLLDNAEKSAAKSGELDGPIDLHQGWIDAISSLRADIGERRFPRPASSMHTPTSMLGWFDEAQPLK